MQQEIAGIARKRRINRWGDILPHGRIRCEAPRNRVQIHDGLPEIRTGHQKLVPERCAARSIPRDTVAPTLRVVKMAGRSDQLVCRVRGFKPLFGEQILAI